MVADSLWEITANQPLEGEDNHHVKPYKRRRGTGQMVCQAMKLKDLLLSKNKNRFYIMHLSYGNEEGIEKETRLRKLWDFSLRKNLIGLDLTNYVKDDWPKARNSARKSLIDNHLQVWIGQFDKFCTKMCSDSMEIGDIVLILEGLSDLLGVVEVTTGHRYQPELAESRGSGFFDHVREVSWHPEGRKFDFDERREIPIIEGFVNTLAIVKMGTTRWSTLTPIEMRLNLFH